MNSEHTQNFFEKKHSKSHLSLLTDIFEEFSVNSEKGLTEEEVFSRLDQYGKNSLPRRRVPSIFEIILHQFKNPLTYILAAAAVASILIAEYSDAIFIMVVLLVNAVIGTYQEWKAEQSSQALEKMLSVKVHVLRNSEQQEIAAEDVVPGDILILESGSLVPADGRIIDQISLQVDESPLTGESEPVEKNMDWEGEYDTPVADQKNMLFAGTTIVRGRVRAVVVTTGIHTVVGTLAKEVFSADAGLPPLIVRLERFTRMIGFVVLGSVLFISIIGILQGMPMMEIFFFGVALAVSAIPEGLPVVVTIALAIGTTRMAKRGVIVRRLAAVEGLGSCSMIASDKTGTLTRNQLTGVQASLRNGEDIDLEGDGEFSDGLRDLLLCGILCNEGEFYKGKTEDEDHYHGDPTDIALLSLASRYALDIVSIRKEFTSIHEIPFESDNRYAASVRNYNNTSQVFVKGAPEKIIEMCKTHDGLMDFLEIAKNYAEKGLRVLGFASNTNVEKDFDFENDIPELHFLGFIGMKDPLREGVIDAVKACKDAGIIVTMVTGDHPVTALAISRELGFASNMSEVITGSELSSLSDEELAEKIASIRVFARTAPVEKLRIVNAARSLGHFVAVTGDGVNDAPALRSANVGVAMGKSGTDVARDASDIVLSDDNFSTIVAGIEEGRIAYDNIRKVICLLVSCGAAEVLMVILAVVFGYPLPLVPVQFLWLNLVTNGIQDKALAFEPGEGDVLKRKPRRSTEKIFDRLMIHRILLAALVMGGLSFMVFIYLMGKGWSEDEARNIVLLLMVLFQNVHIGNCRSEYHSAFVHSPFRSPYLLLAALSALGLHLFVMHTAFGARVLGMHVVSIEVIGLLCAIASSVFIVIEIHKWWWNRFRATDY
jgi:P-type Ca2+ transporter type 2C